MPAPLVSIILPAYKHEKYVQETIRSAVAQTYSNIELIVIDDGSPDNTWAKIEELRKECEARFSRVVLARQDNIGLCKTYNKLLAQAAGEFIFILNSDDVAYPDAVATTVAFLSGHPDYAVAVGNNDLIDSAGTKIYWDKEQNVSYGPREGFYESFKDFYAHPRRGHDSIDFLNDAEFGSYFTLVHKCNHIPNGYLIRKSIFDIVGGYTNDAPVEDWHLFLQIAKHSKIKYIDKVLLSYRWHAVNTIQLRDGSYRFFDRTLRHEKSLVDACEDQAVKKIFYDFFNKRKYVVNLSPVFSIYIIRNFMFKKKFLELFGKSFQFSSSDRPFKD